MIRPVPLYLILAMLAGCTSNAATPGPAAFQSAWSAAEQVCARPTSHRQIVRAVRDLDWRLLREADIPKDVTGDGMVIWTAVAQSPDRDTIVAAGRLGATSFCRVYAARAPAAPLQPALERAQVFGAPLGAPDFRETIRGSDVVGWHKSADGDWRAIHLWVARTDPATRPDRMQLEIEVTRPAAWPLG